MKFHHIGYAVKNISKAAKKLTSFGYYCNPIISDYDRNISIIFAEKDMTTIELIAILDSEKPSALGDTIKKRGVGPYHICYEVSNLNQAIEELQNNRFFVIIPPQKACALEDRNVAFLWNNDIGMIELLESGYQL